MLATCRKSPWDDTLTSTLAKADAMAVLMDSAEAAAVASARPLDADETAFAIARAEA